MTSVIRATAHCSTDKELVVTVDGQTTRLQNGESKEFYVYDDREVIAKEALKGTDFKAYLTEKLETAVVAWADSKIKSITKLGENQTAQHGDIYPTEFEIHTRTDTLDIESICKAFVECLERVYEKNNYEDENYFTFRTPTIVDIDGAYEGKCYKGVFINMLVSFS